MFYALNEAKSLIIKAGLELCEKKLIARTWGNISARISETEFVITPSGIPYDKITYDNLVIVKIDDCSWSGNIKPSGEKKVHAVIYKLRPDVNFILHTHQNYATAISVDGKDKEFVPVAKYGLPSTKKLVKNIEKVVSTNKDNNSILMQRHGVLVFDDNYEKCFKNALKLEEEAKELFDNVATKKPANKERKPYLDDYAQMFGYSKKAVEEDAEAVNLIKLKNTLAARYQKQVRPMKCLDVMLQHIIYKKKYSKLKNK